MNVQKGLSVTVNGVVYSASEQINVNAAQQMELIMPLAQNATLTTVASATAGTLTMGTTSHGLVVNDIIDIYGDTGAGTPTSRWCAYQATVSAVTGASVSFTGAAGSSLSGLAGAAVRVAKPASIVMDIFPSQMRALVIASLYRCNVVLTGAANAVMFARHVQPDNSAYLWTVNDGVAVPVSGNVTKVWMSTNSLVNDSSGLTSVLGKVTAAIN